MGNGNYYKFLASENLMELFSVYLQFACCYGANANMLKDLRSTFLVYLHRKEI